MSAQMATAIQLSLQHGVPSAQLHNGQTYLLDSVTPLGNTQHVHYSPQAAF